MGCGNTKQSKSSRPALTVLSGRKDEKGRYTVPQGKTRLDLSDQKLKQLPAYAGTESVERLDVSRNELTALPADMVTAGEWEKLSELSLCYNSFPKVPAVLGQLPSLQVLKLTGNHFATQSGDVFKALTLCSQLRVLHLGDCALPALPTDLAECPALRELHVAQNKLISLEHAPMFPSVHTINAADCAFTEVPQPLACCPNLTSLDLSDNPLAQADQLSQLVSLRDLRLRRCGPPSGRPIGEILTALAELPALQSLDLGYNAIPSVEGIGRLTALTRLDLTCCGLTAPPAGLDSASSLSELVLQSNTLSKLDGIASGGLRWSLTSLNIAGNPFTMNVRPEDQCWPELGKFRCLKNLIFQQWADKANSRNSNPYSTRIPWSLISLPLASINGIPLPEPFTRDPGANLAVLLKGSYFKVDMGIEWEIRFSYHIKLLRTFQQHRAQVTYDFRSSIQRYKMFLSLQHRMADEKFIAPLDVAFLHYIHMTHPIQYRKDCERMFGKIVGNFYHGVDRSSMHIRSHKRYLASVRIWDQEYLRAGCPWLHFEYPSPKLVAEGEKWEGAVDDWPGATPVLAAAEFTVDFAQVAPEIFDHVSRVASYGDFLDRHAPVALDRYLRFLAVEGMRYAALPSPKQQTNTVPADTGLSNGSPEEQMPDHAATTAGQQTSESSAGQPAPEDSAAGRRAAEGSAGAPRRDSDESPPSDGPSPDGSSSWDCGSENQVMPSRLAATPGIQLMLHVHQCMPQKVFSDLAVVLGGRFVDLNLRVSGKHDPAFESAMAETKRLWYDAWGEDYLSENLLDDNTPTFFSPTAQSHMRNLARRMFPTGPDEQRKQGLPTRSSLRRPPAERGESKGAVVFVHSAGL